MVLYFYSVHTVYIYYRYHPVHKGTIFTGELSSRLIKHSLKKIKKDFTY